MKHVVMNIDGEIHIFLVKKIGNLLGSISGVITFENVIDTNPLKLKKYLRKDIKRIFKKALLETLITANELGYNFDLKKKNKSSYLVSSIVENGLNSNKPKKVYIDRLYSMLGLSKEDIENEVLLVFGINDTVLRSKMGEDNENI